MKYTGNYNLKKPDGTDVVNIQDLNDNMDIIDTQIKSLNDNKVQKETGKGLSSNDFTTAEKNKLSGIAGGANNYVHPATHPPSIIAQDANNRFVTDAEKANWNAKASTAVATQSVNGLMSSTDKKKLDGVQAGAQVNTVDSVNGKTGAVNLSADDVGAIPKTGGTLTGPINIPSIFLGDSSIYLYEEGGNFGLRVGKSPNYSFFAVSPSDMWFGGNKIWHAGNDGVGSGLDADTLDGKHWTDILFQFGGALNTAGGLLDWNAHTVPGTAPVLLMGNAANGPGPASYFHVQNYEYGNKRDGTGQITQVAIPYASPTTGKFDFYVRGRYSGVWSAWQKIGGGEMYTKPRASSIYLDTTVANQYYTLANITGGGKFTNLIGHSYLSSSRYGASQFKARFTVDGVVNDVNIQSAHAGHDNIVALGIYSEFNFNTSLKVEVASEWVYGLGAQAHYTLK